MPEHRYVDETGFAGHTLSSPSGVTARVLANGALETLTVGPIMVNLLVGSPVGGGATKLYGRTHDDKGALRGFSDLLERAAVSIEQEAIIWRGVFAGADYVVTLGLHPVETAWCWTVDWAGDKPFDVVLVQDVGIAARGQAQNNEAYTSQYIDHRVLTHPDHGPVLAARQNLSQPGGHPWVMHACVGGAVGATSDGLPFYGASHRTTGTPEMLGQTDWPAEVLQHEWSMHGLCSKVRPAAEPICFVGRFIADHPAATSDADLKAIVTDGFGGTGVTPIARPSDAGDTNGRDARSTDGGEAVRLLTVVDPTTDDLTAWCPGPHRHVETLDETTASFFHGTDRHAVTRGKESRVTRRHGHLLRTGGTPVPSADAADAPLCSTVWAHGVFASHVCLGKHQLQQAAVGGPRPARHRERLGLANRGANRRRRHVATARGAVAVRHGHR